MGDRLSYMGKHKINTDIKGNLNILNTMYKDIDHLAGNLYYSEVEKVIVDINTLNILKYTCLRETHTRGIKEYTCYSFGIIDEYTGFSIIETEGKIVAIIKDSLRLDEAQTRWFGNIALYLRKTDYFNTLLASQSELYAVNYLLTFNERKIDYIENFKLMTEDEEVKKLANIITNSDKVNCLSGMVGHYTDGKIAVYIKENTVGDAKLMVYRTFKRRQNQYKDTLNYEIETYGFEK